MVNNFFFSKKLFIKVRTHNIINTIYQILNLELIHFAIILN